MNLARKLLKEKSTNRDRTSLEDRVRVCFYGRVSTQHEAQVNALDNQLQWYNSVLRDHPNWDKVATYVDRGVTGTDAKKRQGFMQMIEDASKGKFDLICTREVSRFARNTIDSLAYTRYLASLGVEVFFYNDNIWSCEKDGELRLTIMSAMAQEESKHISDRVLAGQQTSREKGVLYGSGNILGYKLVKGMRSVDNTYEIIEEEAETVRMIYDMYMSGMGTKRIASELIALGRKQVNGGVRWCASYVLRILDNKTYAGYLCYNKSNTANFLEHKRVVNHDKSTYIYVKGNFPAIIPEEYWNEVQAYKSKKISRFSSQSRGKPQAKDRWVKCLVCECGRSYKRYRWRVNANGEEYYGYTCRHQAAYRKKSFRTEHGLDGTGYCDVPSVCEWKLDFMLKSILDRLWTEKNNFLDDVVSTVQDNYTEEKKRNDNEYQKAKLQRELDRLRTRKQNLLDMRLDELIDSLSYEQKNKAIAERIQEVEESLSVFQEEVEVIAEPVDVSVEIQNVKAFLESACDLEQKKLSEELVSAVVERVVPTEAGAFKWYIKGSEEATITTFNEEDYVLCDKFTLNFEQARTYRKTFGNYIRARQWNDINVEVYIKKEQED